MQCFNGPTSLDQVQLQFDRNNFQRQFKNLENARKKTFKNLKHFWSFLACKVFDGLKKAANPINAAKNGTSKTSSAK